MKNQSATLHIRIDPATLAKLHNYCIQHNLSLSDATRQAILNFVNTNVNTFVNTNPLPAAHTKQAKLDTARSILASLQNKPQNQARPTLDDPVTSIPVSPPKDDDWDAIRSP